MRRRPEIHEAYDDLRARWPGKVVPLRPAGERGRPDFALIHKFCTWYCEVKSVQTAGLRVSLQPHQVDVLNEYSRIAETRLLVLVGDTGVWWMRPVTVEDQICLPVYVSTPLGMWSRWSRINLMQGCL